jgi:HK97 family phage portal protein
MGMIDRLLAPLGFERRTLHSSPSWTAMGLALGRGPAVNERLAENFAAVCACVGAVSSALAMAPAYVYRRTSEGRFEVPDHPLAAMARTAPNERQTWPDMMEAVVASTLLSGNGLLEIEREGGALSGLRFIPWSWVNVLIAPSGRLAYDVTEQTGLYGQTGRTRRLLADDVVHIRDRSDDGILGRSRLSRSADTVAAALQGNEFARAFLANGAAPTGAIRSEQTISPEAMERLRQAFDERQQGASNAGRVLILSDGLTFTPFQVSPEDAELLGSRKFAVEEICRLYQVPPPLVQDYSNNTFTNSQAAGRWFAQFTLGPWARKIEAALTRSLLPAGSGLEVEIDLSVFLRGDPEARWAAHKIAVDSGILDADEIREIEGFNPRGQRAAVA